ncbi:MAG: hypothetical protein AAFP84_11095 [Actinomycetota bacterium]
MKTTNRIRTALLGTAFVVAACGSDASVGSDTGGATTDPGAEEPGDAPANDPAEDDVTGSDDQPDADADADESVDEAPTGPPANDQSNDPDDPADDATDSPADADESEPTTTPVATTISPEAGTTQERLAQQAIADLAARNDVAPSEIGVRSVEEVTWRDGAIGCPQKDFAYTQALVPGMRVVLDHAGFAYHYHQGGNRELFYCPNPEDPLES